MKFQFDRSETKSNKNRDKKGKFVKGNKSAVLSSTVMTDINCLYNDPQCKHKANSRGLCKRHYAVALRCIKKHKTTWKRLVREGKALEARIPFGVNRQRDRKQQQKFFTTKAEDFFEPNKTETPKENSIVPDWRVGRTPNISLREQYRRDIEFMIRKLNALVKSYNEIVDEELKYYKMHDNNNV